MSNKKSKNQCLKKLTLIKEINKEIHKLIFRKEKVRADNKIEKTNIILKFNKILIKIKLLAFF